MTAIEKLDDLLINRLTVDRKYESIRDEVVNDFSDPELTQAIRKLIKDGFAECSFAGSIKNEFSSLGGTSIRRTFDGQLFAEMNGYIGELNRKNGENIRLVNLENAQRRSQNFLTVLTVIIAFGTLIAAVYYGIEILKYLKVIPGSIN